MKIKAIVDKLARLSLTMNAITEPQDAKVKLSGATSDFHDLYENFSTLEDEEQTALTSLYFEGQRSFHTIGNALISMVCPVEFKFGEFPNEQKEKNAIDEPMEHATKELSNTGGTSTQNVDEINPQQSVIQNDPSNDRNQSVLPPANELMEVDTNKDTQPEGLLLSHVSMDGLAKAIQIAVNRSLEKPEKPEWQEGQPLRELYLASYQEQSIMMAPVYALPQQSTLSEKAINTVITAINTVAKNFPLEGYAWSQQTKRMLIMHVTSVLDSATQDCWRYRTGTQEPTLEDLINFLIERKFDINKKNPLAEFKIPKKKPELRPSEQRARPTEKASTSKVRSRSNSKSSMQDEVNKKCSLCARAHVLKDCSSFFKLSFQAREEFLYDHKLCISCFSNTHTAAKCHRKACDKCLQKHSDLVNHRS